MTTHRVVALRHLATQRTVPLDVKTVIGRSPAFYRYGEGDENPDRLRPSSVDHLSALNYVTIARDKKISRVHGLIDPEGPNVTDLQTRNGTFLNGSAVPRFEEDFGAGATLVDGDRLHLGNQDFEVTVANVAWSDHVASVHARRHALLVTDMLEERREKTTRLATQLSEKKGFDARVAIFGHDTVRGLRELQERSDDEGITVLVIRAQVEHDAVLAHGGKVPFGRVTQCVAALRGRKVIVLETDANPRLCEQVFLDEGSRDMALVTSIPRRGQGAVPAADALDAMIAAGTNRLDFGWFEHYKGPLRVTFGRLDRSGERLEHQLDAGTTIVRF